MSILKTYTNIWGSFCTFENLKSAYEKARKHKSATPSVKKFDKHWRLQLCILLHELRKQTYKPLPMKTFVLRDPKTRVISISDFRDRVVHHAVVNVLQPIFEPRFIDDSYASRKGKGALAALKRFDSFKQKVTKNGKLVCNVRNNNDIQGFVLKADVKQYFQTVDHEVLLSLLSKKIKDEKFLALIKQILSNYKSGISKKGMSLGNWTSQFFANVYLDKLDQFIKQKLHARYYIRYVDDFVILHSSKAMLQMYKHQICGFLANLKLQLNKNKTRIIPLKRGVNFLGYRVFYHYKLLRKRNLWKIKKTLKNNLKEYQNGQIDSWCILQTLESWSSYAVHGNTYKLRQNIFRAVKRELLLNKSGIIQSK